MIVIVNESENWRRSGSGGGGGVALRDEAVRIVEVVLLFERNGKMFNPPTYNIDTGNRERNDAFLGIVKIKLVNSLVNEPLVGNGNRTNGNVETRVLQQQVIRNEAVWRTDLKVRSSSKIAHSGIDGANKRSQLVKK